MSDATRQGEFRGDFTRDSFDSTHRYRRVLMQQGRVQIDADWNEQTSILLHYLRVLTTDLIGAHGGPASGFKIDVAKDEHGDPIRLDFVVGAGRYYVDGILCESDAEKLFSKRPEAAGAGETSTDLAPSTSYVAFLDVWERHISHLQDPAISEVALNGADTATRAQVVAQLKVLAVAEAPDLKAAADALQAERAKTNPDAAKIAAAQTKVDTAFATSQAQSAFNATLRARALVTGKPEDPCTISPESSYRGANNQLYRVEIHREGSAWDGKPSSAATAATFKWSRDNGSVAYPIREWAGGDIVTLASLGRDDVSRLRQHDWVEVIDDTVTLQGNAGGLFQVVTVTEDLTVKLRIPEGVTLTQYQKDDARHPLLRRWDQGQQNGSLSDGAVLVKEGDGDAEDQWIVLEDGVQVQFAGVAGTKYRPGDYWLIPARTAAGDVAWPPQKNPATDAVETYANTDHVIPAALPPHGIEHRYAPLAYITLDADGQITPPITDLRRVLAPLATAPVA